MKPSKPRGEDECMEHAQERHTHACAKEKLAMKPSKPRGEDEYMEHAQERDTHMRQREASNEAEQT